MRETIRDIDRLQHMLEQIDALLDLVPHLSFDTIDTDKVRPYIARYIDELSEENTLKK